MSTVVIHWKGMPRTLDTKDSQATSWLSVRSALNSFVMSAGIREGLLLSFLVNHFYSLIGLILKYSVFYPRILRFPHPFGPLKQ